MNKIYKLKYSKQLNQMIVVSELATNADKESSVSLDAELSSALAPDYSQRQMASPLTTLVSLGTALFSVASLGLAGSASAEAPRSGLEVVSGSVSVSKVGDTTNLITSPNAILNWDKFNINANEIVRFIQESSKSSVLNRVLGGEVSKILGQLQSNGRVFIVNPAGIVFGKGSSVNVQSLVASTLDITDANFKAGRYVFNQDKDKAIAGVINAGMIKVADNGSISLVGGQVLNKGVLEARKGSVYLLAGNSIEISDLNNPNISYKVTAKNKAVNLGSIIGKNVSMVANKVSNGLVEESRPSFADLLGEDSSNFEAKISASGEVILFGGRESFKVENTAFKDKEFENKLEVAAGQAISNGEIKVSNKKGKAGTVKVLGDYLYLGEKSKIDASGEQGGVVLIGGDAAGKGDLKLASNTAFSKKHVVDVSGTGKVVNDGIDRTLASSSFDQERGQGDAGNIVVWGNVTGVDGTFIGTSQYGKGMLLETSGHAIDFKEKFEVDASSKADERYFGAWLIDPYNLFVTDLHCTGGEENECGASGKPYKRPDFIPTIYNDGSYYVQQVGESWLGNNGNIKQAAQENVNTVIFTEDINQKFNSVGTVYLHTSIQYVGDAPVRFVRANLTTKANKHLVIETFKGGRVSFENSTVNIGNGQGGTLTIKAGPGNGTQASGHSKLIVDKNSNVQAGKVQAFLGGGVDIKGTLKTNSGGTEGAGDLEISSLGDMCVTGTLDAGARLVARSKTLTVGEANSETKATLHGNIIDMTTDGGNINIKNASIRSEGLGKGSVYGIKIDGGKDSSSQVVITDTEINAGDTRTLFQGGRLVKVAYTPEANGHLTLKKTDFIVPNGQFVVDAAAVTDLTFTDSKVLAKTGEFTTGKFLITGRSEINVTEGGTLNFNAKQDFTLNDGTVTGKGSINIQSSDKAKINSDKANISANGENANIHIKSTNNLVEVTDGAKISTNKGSVHIEGQNGVLYRGATFSGENSGKLKTTVHSGNLEIHGSSLESPGQLEFDVGGATDVVIDKKSKLKAKLSSANTFNFNNTGNFKLEDSTINGENDVSIQVKNTGNALITTNSVIETGPTGTFDIRPTGSLEIKDSSRIISAGPGQSFIGGNNFKVTFSTVSAGELTLDAKGDQASIIAGSTVTATQTLNAQGKKLHFTKDEKGHISTVKANKFAITLNEQEGELIINHTAVTSTGPGSSIDGGKILKLGTSAVINSNRGTGSESNTELKLTAQKVTLDDNAQISGNGGSVTIGDDRTTSIVAGSNTQVNTGTGDVNFTAKGYDENDNGGTIQIKGSVRARNLNLTASGNIDLTGVDSDRSFFINGGLAVTAGRKITIGEGTSLSAKTVSLHGGNTTEFAKKDKALADDDLAIEVKHGKLVSREKALEVIAHSGSVYIGENAELKGNDSVEAEEGTRIYARGKATWTGGATSSAERNLNISAGKEVSVETDITNSKKVTLAAVDNEKLEPKPSEAQKGKGVVNVKESVIIQAKDFVAEATKDINFKAGSSVSATNSLKAQAVNQTHVAKGTTLKTTSKAGGSGDVLLQANKTDTGKVLVEGTVASANNLTVKGDDSQFLSTSTSTAEQGLFVRGKKITVQGASLTANGNELSIGGFEALETVIQGATLTTGNHDVNVRGNNSLTVTGGTINSGRDLNLSAPAGQAKAEEAKVTVARDINITAGNIILKKQNLAAQNISVISLKEGGTSISDSALTATVPDNGKTSGTLKISGTGHQNLSNTSLKGKDLEVKSTDEKVTLEKTQIESKKGNVSIEAQKNINIGNGTNISAKEAEENAGHICITTTSADGSIISDGANITAGTNGSKVSLKSGKHISLNNTNISSHKDLDLLAEKDIKVIGGSQLNSSHGNINLNSTSGDILSEGGVFGTPNGSPVLTANKGNITLNATDLTIKEDLNLVAGKNVSLGNGTNLSAGRHISIEARDGNVTSEGVNITAGEKGNVNITAQRADDNGNKVAGHISLNNTNIASSGTVKLEGRADVTVKGKTKISSTGNIDLISHNGSVTSEGGVFDAKGEGARPSFSATEGNITLNATNVTVKGDFDLTAGKNVTLGNGTNITAQGGHIHLTANDGNVTTEGSNLTASLKEGADGSKEADVVFTANKVNNKNAGNININNTNIASAGPIKALADNDVTVTGNSKLNTSAAPSGKPSKGDIVLTAKNGNLTSEGTAIIAPNGSPKLSATNGSITLNATNVTVREGDLDLKAGKNIYLGNGTNLTAKDGNVTLTAGAGNITSEGVNITAGGTNHGVTLNAKADPNNKDSGSISLNNTNISANGSVVAEADKDLTITGASVINTSGSPENKGNITLKAKNGNLTSEATRIIAPKGSPKLSAENGDITLNATNISVKEGDLDLKAGKNIYLGNGTNLSAQNGGVHLSTTKGNITSEGVNITAGGMASNVTLSAGGAGSSISLNNTNISSHGPIKAEAEKDVTVKGNSILNTTPILGEDGSPVDGSIQGNITLTAKNGNLTSEGTRIIAPNGSPKLSADHGDITLNATNVTVKEGDLDLKAGKNIYLGNGTNLTAEQGSVSLTAKEGNVTSEGVNITAKGENSNVTIKAGSEGHPGSISLNNTNIAAKGPVIAEAEKDVSITGRSIINTTGAGDDKGNITLTAKKGNLTSESTRIIAPKGSPKLSAEKGDITLNDTDVIVRKGDLDLNAGKNIYLGNGTNLTAETGGVHLTAAEGNITSEGVNITASGANSNVTLKAGSDGKPGSITLNNTNISANGPIIAEAEKDVTVKGRSILNTRGAEEGKGDVILNAKKGNLTSEATNIISPNGNPKLTAEHGDITLNATNVTIKDGDLALTAGKNIYLGNGTNLTAKTGNVKLTAKDGNVTSEGVNITSDTGKVEIIANKGSDGKGGTITLNNTNISSQGDISTSGDKDVNLGNGTKLFTKDGNVSLTAKGGNVTSEGVNISANEGKVDIVANKTDDGKGGAITLNNTNISSKGDISAKGDKDINLGNGTKLTTKEGNVTLHAKDGNITSEGSNITALGEGNKGGGYVSITAEASKDNPNAGVTTLNNTNISAKKDIKAAGKNGLNLGNGTQLTSKEGNVTLDAGDGSITSQGSNISAENGRPIFNAPKGNISLTNTNVSSKGDIAVEAGKNVNLGNGTRLYTTEGNVSIHAKDGNVTSEGSNITAEGKGDKGGYVSIKAQAGKDNPKGGVTTLNNTNISAKKDITTESSNGINLGNGTQLTSKDGNVTLDAGKGSIISQGSNITADNGKPIFKAPQGDITLNNTNVSTTGDLDVEAGKNVNLGNGTRLTSKEGNISVTANDGNVTSEGTNITADKGKVDITATSKRPEAGITTLNNTNISAKEDITTKADKGINLGNGTQITSANGNVTLDAGKGSIKSEGSNISADNGRPIFKAPNGDISLNNTNVSSKGDIDLDAGKNVNLGNGTRLVSKNGNITLNAQDGNVTSEGSNITAENGKVAITAHSKGNPDAGVITLNNTNISARDDISTVADKDVNLGNGTQITSVKGNITIVAKGGNVTTEGSNITAKGKDGKGGNVNITATANPNNPNSGSITLNNTNISSKNVGAVADKDVSLGNGTRIVAEVNVTIKAKEKASITGSNVTSGYLVDIKSGDKLKVKNSNISSRFKVELASDKGLADVENNNFEVPYFKVEGGDGTKFINNKINKLKPENGKAIIIGKKPGTTIVTDNDGYATDIGINGNDITDVRNSWNPYPPRYNSDLSLPDAPPVEKREGYNADQPLGFGDQVEGDQDSYRDSGRDTKGSTISSEDPLTSGDDLTLEEGNGIGKGRTVEGKGHYSRASNRRALSGADSSYHYFLGQCYNTAYKIFSAKGFSGGDKDLTLYQLERKYKLSAKEAEALRRSCSDKEMRLVFRDLEEKVLSGQ